MYEVGHKYITGIVWVGCNGCHLYSTIWTFLCFYMTTQKVFSDDFSDITKVRLVVVWVMIVFDTLLTIIDVTIGKQPVWVKKEDPLRFGRAYYEEQQRLKREGILEEADSETRYVPIAQAPTLSDYKTAFE